MGKIFAKISMGVSAVWVSVLLYFCSIFVILFIADPKKNLAPELIINRSIAIIIFISTLFIKKHLNRNAFHLITILLIYTLLTGIYNETAVYNSAVFPYIDEKLMLADQNIFSFQPSLEFSKILPHCIFNELFYFGYFSYYLMPLIILFVLYKKYPAKIEAFGFVLITSFLIYYILFIIFPAAGPQFFFEAPLNKIQACGPMGSIMQLIQKYGESPTGAFPSSHVGVCLIMLFWLFQNKIAYAGWFIPVAIILIFSTVYIKAHYAVDVIAGIFTAPIIYFLTIQFFRFIKRLTHADQH